jgi:hypothetical protein
VITDPPTSTTLASDLSKMRRASAAFTLPIETAIEIAVFPALVVADTDAPFLHRESMTSANPADAAS